MMPRTIHGLSALECVSALQKCIRRGLEKEAMQFAVELMHSSKIYFNMTCKRIQVIGHEDIDNLKQPWLGPFVWVACEQAIKWYDRDTKKLGKSRMAIGNAIRMLARADKNREGDHFQASIGWASLLENFEPSIDAWMCEDIKPTLQDWMWDKHTSKGRRLGRGLNHFRDIGTLLDKPPAEPDSYEAEAYRLWALIEAGKGHSYEQPEMDLASSD